METGAGQVKLAEEGNISHTYNCHDITKLEYSTKCKSFLVFWAYIPFLYQIRAC